ncbi:hypothetical protein ABT324_11545 [Saccharopolyspora sp. NPDC000359]|uniref:hypothetical protein n=1 Tax=Saccharopolyspora sp. NPDC000359 TaxID=3154251 RepID=UPI00332B1EA8
MTPFPPTRYFYAGHPEAIVSIHPVSTGVGIAITWPTDDTKPGTACRMSPDQFRELLADGAAALAEIERRRAEATHQPSFTDQEGTR